MTPYRYTSDRAVVRMIYRYVYLVVYRQLAISFYLFVCFEETAGEVKRKSTAANFPNCRTNRFQVTQTSRRVELSSNSMEIDFLLTSPGFSILNIVGTVAFIVDAN